MSLQGREDLLAALIALADEGRHHPTVTALDLLLYDRGINPGAAQQLAGERAASYLRAATGAGAYVALAGAWLEGLAVGAQLLHTANTTPTQEDA